VSAVVLPFTRPARIGSTVRARHDLAFGDRKILAGETGRVAATMLDAFDHGVPGVGVEWASDGFAIVRWTARSVIEVIS
jgi:hypothetical protein